MRGLSPIAAVIAITVVPVLACGQSGAPAQGAVNQALGNIAKGVAAQAWSGTVTITQSAENTASQQDVIHNSTTTQKVSNSVTITLTKGIAVAQISFDLQDSTDLVDSYDGYKNVGTIRERTVASGSNNKDAAIKVSLNDNGTYEIEYTSGGLTGRYTKVETSEIVCGSDPSCKPTKSSNNDSADPTNQGFASGGVNGTYDAKTQPKVLSGSTTEPFDYYTGSKTPGKTTITWNLTR